MHQSNKHDSWSLLTCILVCMIFSSLLSETTSDDHHFLVTIGVHQNRWYVLRCCLYKQMLCPVYCWLPKNHTKTNTTSFIDVIVTCCASHKTRFPERLYKYALVLDITVWVQIEQNQTNSLENHHHTVTHQIDAVFCALYFHHIPGNTLCLTLAWSWNRLAGGWSH